VTAANAARDIRIGVISSLIASVITYTAIVAFRFRLPTVSRLVFWRSFSHDLVVLISEMEHRYDPDMRRGEQPPLTPLGDAITLADFLRYFKRRFKADPIVVSAQTPETFDRVKHQNLLVIGGPKYNFGAHSLLLDLDPRLPYQFRRLRPLESGPLAAVDPEMKRFVGDSPDAPQFISDPARDRDYGCVIMAPNPYNEERKVLVVAGLSTLATLGASAWLQRTHPGLWFRARRRGFETIVSCRTSGITRVSHVKPERQDLLAPES
jgi:hypothetical protein